MPLFPIGQTIDYNYINNFLENYFCCQVTITITRIIPLRIIYVIISWTMVIPEWKKRYTTFENAPKCPGKLEALFRSLNIFHRHLSHIFTGRYQTEVNEVSFAGPLLWLEFRLFPCEGPVGLDSDCECSELQIIRWELFYAMDRPR